MPTPYGHLPRVDKAVDIFVPSTVFRRRGKLYGTRVKAGEIFEIGSWYPGSDSNRHSVSTGGF